MTTPPNPDTSVPARAHGQPFDTVLRGYERRQVDDYVSRTSGRLHRLGSELAESERKRRQADEHARDTEHELRELRARSAHGEPRSREDSFGYRAEKLLRIAEQEAVEVRTSASREAAAILEQARTGAERHRHEVEQTLISRASQLEQQAAQRTAEVQQREQAAAEQVVSAREQADQLHAAAVRAVDRLREESETAAHEAKLRLGADLQRQRDHGAQEVSRLETLRSGLLSELARLSEVLTAELHTSRPTASPQRDDRRERRGRAARPA